MVFRPRQRRQTLDICIQIDNNVIEHVKETVFLGVILDEQLGTLRSETRRLLERGG